MRRLDSRRFWLVFVPVAAALAAVAVILATSGGEEAGNGTGGRELTPDIAPAPPAGGSDSDKGSGAPASPDEERRTVRAVRAYVAAIDDRDGAAVCAALAPGAIHNLRLPREGGGCARSLERSIGYRDPRGYPVFGSAGIDSIEDVAISAAHAIQRARGPPTPKVDSAALLDRGLASFATLAATSTAARTMRPPTSTIG